MLQFLKAPADAPQISDKHEIDVRYRYWRRHILLTIWLGYALFYFTRKSFNSAVPEILASGVLSRSDIGLLATLFYVTYGLSKFVSGIVSDRSNARYFMGIGLIATGIINILFGFSTSLWTFAVLWVLNQAVRRLASCAITSSSLVGITTAGRVPSLLMKPDLPKRAARLRSWSISKPSTPSLPRDSSRNGALYTGN